MAGIAIVLIVLGAWTVMLLRPSTRPDLMKSVAGCYRGDGSLADVEIAISPKGVLNAQGQTLKGTVTEDKVGFSFLPERRITFDPAFASKLIIDSASPLLLRISADRHNLTIPGDVPNVTFKKESCSNGRASQTDGASS